MLRQRDGPEAEVVVFRIGIEQENICHALLGDKAFEIAHIGFTDARGAAANHVEASNLVGLTLLADVEKLANADGQWEALAARGVLETVFELAAIQRKQRA